MKVIININELKEKCFDKSPIKINPNYLEKKFLQQNSEKMIDDDDQKKFIVNCILVKTKEMRRVPQMSFTKEEDILQVMQDEVNHFIK